MKVTALAGGTGSAKLLRGLSRLPVELTVVANVGDNVWMYGAYVCPDLDIGCYTLAGIADTERGWGVAGDTFAALQRFSELGLETWFRLGDRDLAVCLARTEMMRRGSTLTQATLAIRGSLGVKCSMLPATDHPLETRVVTTTGDLHLQEFWVREHGQPRVKRVRYKGASDSRPTREVEAAIMSADRVVLCPANPVTSIGPMLAIPGFTKLLSKSPARITALSPMAGRGSISGPAGKLMESSGVRPDSVGAAGLYSRFLDALIISKGDWRMRPEIEKLGVKCESSDIMIEGSDDETRLAKELVSV